MLGGLSIQYRGRTQTFDHFARGIIGGLPGRTQRTDEHPVQTVLGLVANGTSAASDRRPATVSRQQVVALRMLSKQDLRLVPPLTLDRWDWLPILQPDGYPIAQQISLKLTWAALLDAIRRGDLEQLQRVSSRLSVMLKNLYQRDVAGLAGQRSAGPLS
jgi:hypothetical protein